MERIKGGGRFSGRDECGKGRVFSRCYRPGSRYTRLFFSRGFLLLPSCWPLLLALFLEDAHGFLLVGTSILSSSSTSTTKRPNDPDCCSLATRPLSSPRQSHLWHGLFLETERGVIESGGGRGHDLWLHWK